MREWIVFVLALAGAAVHGGEAPTRQPLQWKCAAWWGPEGSVKAAKEVGFNAIVAGFFGERLSKAVQEGERLGVDVYLDIEFLGGGKFTQVMTDAEEQAIAKKKAASAPDVATWKPGERGDPLGLSLWCFARPEALAHGKQKIQKYLTKYPVQGVCLDAIGFRNQYGCHCSHCKEQKRKYAKEHPELKPEVFDGHYGEYVLTHFITELAKYVRTIRPDIKLAVHIEPTFAPAPTFARQLPIDRWMTSVSYYSKPHWPYDAIEKLCKQVAGAKGGCVGVPYIGFISGASAKSAERLRRELQIVRESGARAVALFELSDIVKNAAVAKVAKTALLGD